MIVDLHVNLLQLHHWVAEVALHSPKNEFFGQQMHSYEGLQRGVKAPEP